MEFVFGPRDARAILAHFKPRYRDATGIGGLAGRIQDSRYLKGINTAELGRHIGTLGDADATVLEQRFRLVFVDFVLCRAGQCDVAGYAPGAALVETRRLVFVGIFADAAAAHLLEIDNVCQLVNIDAIRVVNESR